jgi:hypothetical protein
VLLSVRSCTPPLPLLFAARLLLAAQSLALLLLFVCRLLLLLLLLGFRKAPRVVSAALQSDGCIWLQWCCLTSCKQVQSEHKNAQHTVVPAVKSHVTLAG